MSTPGGTYDIGGRAVPRVGYGMGGLARAAADPARHDDAVALLRRAHELGVRHLDTAEFYERGLANRLIREALGSRRDDLLLATKMGPPRTTGRSPFGPRSAPPSCGRRSRTTCAASAPTGSTSSTCGGWTGSPG